MGDSRLLYYFEREQSDNRKVYKRADNLHFYSTEYAVWKVFRISAAKGKKKNTKKRLRPKTTEAFRFGSVDGPKMAVGGEKKKLKKNNNKRRTNPKTYGKWRGFFTA